MTDPKQLTPAGVPGLSGDDLNRAVEWWVYGDDLTANSDARIVSAMCRINKRGFYWMYGRKIDIGLQTKEWPTNGSVPIDPDEETLTPDYENRGEWGAGDYCALFLWRNRHGRRWQAVVEAGVAAVRFDARPFTTDANLCLAFWEPGGVLHGWSIINLVDHPQGIPDLFCVVDFAGKRSDGETFQQAACRAAVLSAMAKGGR